MKVWGIGANWGGKSIVKEFIGNDYAGIGWLEDEAPSLYAMMRDIEKGDIVYLKSFTYKNCTLNIKAIGRVTATAFKDPRYFKGKDKHITIQVEWFDIPSIGLKYDFRENGKIDMRNNVYNNTLYREYCDRIIELIKKNIAGK